MHEGWEKDEIQKKAEWQKKRNERIAAKRVEQAELLSRMTEAEQIEYYQRIRESNDEFLRELGIDPKDIRR